MAQECLCLLKETISLFVPLGRRHWALGSWKEIIFYFAIVTSQQAGKSARSCSCPGGWSQASPSWLLSSSDTLKKGLEGREITGRLWKRGDTWMKSAVSLPWHPADNSVEIRCQARFLLKGRPSSLRQGFSDRALPHGRREVGRAQKVEQVPSAGCLCTKCLLTLRKMEQWRTWCFGVWNHHWINSEWMVQIDWWGKMSLICCYLYKQVQGNFTVKLKKIWLFVTRTFLPVFEFHLVATPNEEKSLSPGPCSRCLGISGVAFHSGILSNPPYPKSPEETTRFLIRWWLVEGGWTLTCSQIACPL